MIFVRAILAGLLAVQASASVINLQSRTILHGLLGRQTSDPLADLPPQCRPRCQVIYSQLNTCPTTTCLCTKPNSALLLDCVTCIAGDAPSPTVIAAAQDVLDKFNDLCKANGIPPLTLAPSATSPAASSLPNPSASASGSGPPVVVPTTNGGFTSATAPAVPTTPVQPPVVQSTVTSSGPAAGLKGGALGSVDNRGVVVVAGVLAGVVMALV